MRSEKEIIEKLEELKQEMNENWHSMSVTKIIKIKATWDTLIWVLGED